jgi:hypothetical protein
MIPVMIESGGRGPHETLQTGFDNRLESHLPPTIQPLLQFRDGLLGGADRLIAVAQRR